MTSSSSDETDSRLARRLVAAGLTLVVLTVLHFLVLDRLIPDYRFVPEGHEIDVLPPGGVTLKNGDPQAVLQRDFAVALSDVTGFVRIDAEVEGLGIVRGNRPWHRGRIVFLRMDGQGRPLLDIPHVVGRFWGDTSRKWIGSIYRGDERAERPVVRVELLKATGELRVHRLIAIPLSEQASHQVTTRALMVAWILFVAIATWWTWRRILAGRWLLALAWAVTMTALLLSVVPGKSLSPARMVASEAVDLVATEQATLKEKSAAASANSFSIAKAGHVLMFLAVGFAVFLARGRSSTMAGGVLALSLAGTCELLQVFSHHRTPSLFDLQLNFVSAAAGAVLAFLAHYLFRRFVTRHQI